MRRLRPRRLTSLVQRALAKAAKVIQPPKQVSVFFESAASSGQPQRIIIPDFSDLCGPVPRGPASHV